jgi:hypothetical protein
MNQPEDDERMAGGLMVEWSLLREVPPKEVILSYCRR